MAKAPQIMGWPARMSEEIAAAYLSVGTSTFRARVAEGKYPQCIRDGRRIFWARCELDELIARQFGFASTRQTDTRDQSWDDLK